MRAAAPPLTGYPYGYAKSSALEPCFISSIRRLVVRRAEQFLLELCVGLHESIGRIRSLIFKMLVDSGEASNADDQVHIYWAGTILSDDESTVFKLGIKDDSTLWVLRNEKAPGALRTELSAWCGTRFVWRGLSEQEEHDLTCKDSSLGISAKNVAAAVSLEEAIVDSSLDSPFVFASLDALTAVYYAAAHNRRPSCHVVQIDTTKIPSESKFDVSDAAKCAALEIETGTAISFAITSRIVAIRGHVPREAIVHIHDVASSDMPRGLSKISLRAYRDQLSGSAKAALLEWQVRGVRELLAKGGTVSADEIQDEISSSRAYKASILTAMCALARCKM